MSAANKYAVSRLKALGPLDNITGVLIRIEIATLTLKIPYQ
jgi:hypothetical protein